MMRCIFVLVILLLPSLAHAVTRYADGTIATCSTYTPATRACGAGSALAYTTLQQALAALNPSDRLEIRSGTYIVNSIYGNSAAQDYGGGATSWATATVITNFPGETATIDNSNGGFNIDSAPTLLGTAGSSYIIFEGESTSRFIIDGHDTLVNAFRLNNSANHIRIKNVTIKDQGYVGGITTGTSAGSGSQHCTQKPSFIEILNNEFVGNGSPGAGSGSHGLYPACSSDMLVDGNHFINNEVYGIHFNEGPNINPADDPPGRIAHVRPVIRNNVVEGRRSTGTSTSACLWIRESQDAVVYRNVCLGLGAGELKHKIGFAFGDFNTNLLVLNNTIYDVSESGIQFTGSGGTNTLIIKNNILDDIGIDPFQNASTLTNVTIAGNLCPFNDTSFGGAAPCPVITATPGYANPPSTYTLATGSPAINTGVAHTTYPFTGSAPDIGAYEYAAYLTDSTSYAEPYVPTMGAGGSIVADPTFLTNIMKLTDSGDSASEPECTVGYANVPSFNFTNTKVAAVCFVGVSQRWKVWDFNATTMVRSNPRIMANPPAGLREDLPQWSRTTYNKFYGCAGGTLYEITIPDGASTTWTLTSLHNFAIASEIGVGNQCRQLSVSADDNIFAFHYETSGGTALGWVAYNRSTNTILKQQATTAVNEVQIDKSGRYVHTCCYQTSYLNVFDLQTQVLTPVTVQRYTHVAIGNGIAVSRCDENLATQRLCKRNLSTPNTVTFLTAAGSDLTYGEHLSLVGSDAWVFSTRYSSPYQAGTAVGDGEALLIATDGSGAVRRYAHHHSRVALSDYWAEPHGNISIDGQFIAWSSNWGGSSRNDVYLARTGLTAVVSTVFYVATTGLDANPGSAALPWRTIAKAANTLVAGQTAIVQNGTYVEGQVHFGDSITPRHGTASAPIKLIAENQHQAILSGSTGCNPILAVYSSYVIIENMRIKREASDSTSCSSSARAMIRAWSDNASTNVIIRGVYIDPGSDVGIKTDQDAAIVENSTILNALEGGTGQNVIFRNNVINGNDVFGSQVTGKLGMRNFQLYNNIVHLTITGTVGAIVLGGSSSCCILPAPNNYECLNCVAYNNVVINDTGNTNVPMLNARGCKDCTFMNNVTIGSGSWVMMAGGPASGGMSVNTTWKNNISSCSGGQATYPGLFTATGTVVDYNNFFNCTGAPSQTHLINGNPLFVNPANDWHLQAGSPAINSGTTMTMSAFPSGTIDVSHDYIGTTRTPPWDLGIYDVVTGGGDTTAPAPPSGVTVN